MMQVGNCKWAEEPSLEVFYWDFPCCGGGRFETVWNPKLVPKLLRLLKERYPTRESEDYTSPPGLPLCPANFFCSTLFHSDRQSTASLHQTVSPLLEQTCLWAVWQWLITDWARWSASKGVRLLFLYWANSKIASAPSTLTLILLTQCSPWWFQSPSLSQSPWKDMHFKSSQNSKARWHFR